MAAEVIPFPGLREPNCMICEHASVGDETFCRIYQEFILDERSAAADCEHFDDDPLKE